MKQEWKAWRRRDSWSAISKPCHTDNGITYYEEPLIRVWIRDGSGYLMSYAQTYDKNESVESVRARAQSQLSHLNGDPLA